MTSPQRTAPVIPPPLREQMARGELADVILLDREGRWFHNGIPFRNRRIIDFFNRSVNRTAEGEYCIHYGGYTYPITVEDTAVFVTGVRMAKEGGREAVYLNLSTGIVEALDPATLFLRDDRLYCRVQGGSFLARFHRSPGYHVLEGLDERDGSYYIRLCGQTIELKEQ